MSIKKPSTAPYAVVEAVRLADSAQEDIERQLAPGRAEDFKRHDLRPILEAITNDPEVWDQIARPHGAGRRMTLHGQTVAGFHLFGVEDTNDPRDDAVVIYLIDITGNAATTNTASTGSVTGHQGHTTVRWRPMSRWWAKSSTSARTITSGPTRSRCT